MIKKPELLAPAGSEDCLKAAILAGADAVYLAGKHFGARAFASNFNEEGLLWARRVTKASNTKLYITLNTIVFEHEWPLLCKTLDFLESLQPDSLIIQDIGIAVELRKRNSKIPLHLSTQGAWFGQGGVEELKELGFTRIILPRETSKNEIAEIVKKSPFEIEVFVHGAMCYSISGRCFWSCSLGPRSGNRGTCAQPCRKEYSLGESKKLSPIFSPKDLRLIGDINSLIETGVTSLKIEGRMKSPEYVYQVVKAYREAIDGKKESENKNLDEVFSRASSNGFFYGIQKPSEWKTGRNQGREGYIVGITTGNISNGLVEIDLKDNINQGDGLFWFNANNEKEGSIITFVKNDPKRKNKIWVRGLPNKILTNTELRRTSKNDDESWKSLWDKSLERIPINLAWSGKENTPLCINTTINEQSIHLETEELLKKANQKGLEEGPLQEKFAAIGEEYKINSHNFDHLDSKLFISASSLKLLKRRLGEELKKVDNKKSLSIDSPPTATQSAPSVSLRNSPPPPKSFAFQPLTSLASPNPLPPKGGRSALEKVLGLAKTDKDPFRQSSTGLRLRFWNQVEFLINNLKADSFVVPWSQRNLVSNQKDKKISFWLPPVLNYKQFKDIFDQLKSLKEGKFLCFGWEAFKLAKLLPQLSFELDWCFNIANRNSLNFVRAKGLDAVFSKESKKEGISENINVYSSSIAWNPLVSYTRFNPGVKNEQIVTNSHKDKFFTLPIGNNITAMFLEKKPSKISKSDLPLQLDIAISPEEDSTQVIKSLKNLF